LTTAPTDDGNFVDRNGQLGGLVWLGLCGVVMGVAVAIKWTGVYAGLGLGVLFLWHIISQRKRLFPSWREFWRLMGFCLAFFVAVPILIYVLSYIPFVTEPPSGNPLQKAFDNTVDIFTMHSTREMNEELTSVSPAYDWPIMRLPVMFQVSALEDGHFLSSLYCLGNPVIWWGGIPCILFCFYRFLGKRDAKAGFLAVAYLAQYLPWFFFLNIKFLYHYFPAALFMILMMGYVFDLLARWKPWGGKAVVGFLALAVVVFFVFYPIISGYPSSREYLLSLRWLDGWFMHL
jgi:dolichyl-phosphate-mannose--protein O-mannosyl transferase